MADYREISQGYAQGAIKAAILINGGAAVALLSQLASVLQYVDGRPIGIAFSAFANGTVLGVLAWLCGFYNARYVDIAERRRNAGYSTANRWQHIGVVTVALSAGSFLFGCYRLGLAFLSAV